MKPDRLHRALQFILGLFIGTVFGCLVWFFVRVPGIGRIDLIIPISALSFAVLAARKGDKFWCKFGEKLQKSGWF